MQAFVMYDADLDEWYISAYDQNDAARSFQVFGYQTREQAEADIPYQIRKRRHV